MRTSASGESTLLLLDVVQILSEEKVDYAVVGAMAASVYGAIRASRDADALLSIGVPALSGLEQTFRRVGFRTELRSGDFEDPIGAVLTLQDGFGNQVDLLVGIRGFDAAAFSRSLEVAFDGEPLKFVGLEDFVAMKLFAGRPQDIADAKIALEVALEPVDLNLLRKLAARYGAQTVRSLENVLGHALKMNRKPIRIPGPDHPITISPTKDRVTVTVQGKRVADTREALTLKEAAYPPVLYVPRKDVDMGQLQRTSHQTYCPYKGECSYYSIPAGGERSVNAVWTYETPYAAVVEIKDYLAFYPDRVDAIEVGAA